MSMWCSVDQLLLKMVCFDQIYLRKNRTMHQKKFVRKEKKKKEIMNRGSTWRFNNLRGAANMLAQKGFPSLFFLFFLMGIAASQSFISDDVLQSHGATSRNLLQAKTACNEDFENKNYTILTSQCKGPRYTAEACCTAFKEFACPFVDKINDEKSDCATTMFSYINLYGKYPPGLFANLCREGKDGLACPDNATATAVAKNQKSGAVATTRAPVQVIVAGLIGSFFIHFLRELSQIQWCEPLYEIEL